MGQPLLSFFWNQEVPSSAIVGGLEDSMMIATEQVLSRRSHHGILAALKTQLSDTCRIQPLIVGPFNKST